MTTTYETYHPQFEAHKACVLIPTYNNAGTLAAVVESALAYTSHVIVVSDGATDATNEILQGFPGLQIVSYAPNRGKGWALRQGFKYAISQGYDFVITMDADGQHFASDLPIFLQKISENRDAIVIGARNLQQENMPGKNTFANKFSNFWFYVETGKKAPDTQSGYRLYPVHRMKKTWYICTKYEFEIEVLVRASWRGITIDWAPIQVYYPPAGERVSHFRPFRDFSRISVLNTVLVTIAFLYIKPRDFIRYMLKGENRRAFFRETLWNVNESNPKKAAAIGFGVFMGIFPVWGFQMLIAFALASLFKLNRALVVVAANISIPPMIPFIIYGSLLMGRLFVQEDATAAIFSKSISIESIKQGGIQYFSGAILLAVIAGIVAWMVTFLLLTLVRRKKQVA
ncbi:glycosyltransferase involved in cell wall biosynthesis [Chitinophaga skermanii]|uniref:Glycosyltransferase involved in cell wall biosynthesis n=1 Tax=Chitinophaga skermanii TaxID=331697 RepID=A0A327QG31_9BACT|nr:DUF2062 domain-containing protein [Chitinophaga skermanii]RAJ02602.1 glycosyltransferase involved in cell wall biosynthesis [Chitinophaga skermanii]